MFSLCVSSSIVPDILALDNFAFSTSLSFGSQGLPFPVLQTETFASAERVLPRLSTLRLTSYLLRITLNIFLKFTHVWKNKIMVA